MNTSVCVYISAKHLSVISELGPTVAVLSLSDAGVVHMSQFSFTSHSAIVQLYGGNL